MANHVYFSVSVEANKEAQEALENAWLTETYKRKHWADDSEIEVKELLCYSKMPFFDKVEKTYDEDGDLENSYDWYCNNIGAKWCSMEDWEGSFFSGYSAWRAPYELCSAVVEFLHKYDNEASLKMTYEDEFRNFIGVCEFFLDEDGDSEEEDNYIENDELVQVVEERFDCDIDGDFEWFEEYKNIHGVMEVPQEYLDEVVYNFFETGSLHD